MAPPIDDRSVASFYDALAGEFDDMAASPARIVREEPAFRDIVDRFGIRTAVDAGAGTGFHTLLLARLGVQVTAVDVSAAMLGRLAANAAAAGMTVRTLRAALNELRPDMIPPVDGVVCMGNTLAHLEGEARLTAAIRAISGILKPGGILLCHLLNYGRILRMAERIQDIRERAGVLFVRFYDFAPDRIMFNILRVYREGSGVSHALSSVPLHPFTPDQVKSALATAGFGPPEIRGDLAGAPFDPEGSRDVFFLARRADRA